MPKDTSIKKILVIGSGPIVIGQGCEFDYSGTQACKALREEGYEVVLVNSNPATIMTARRQLRALILNRLLRSSWRKSSSGKNRMPSSRPWAGRQP